MSDTQTPSIVLLSQAQAKQIDEIEQILLSGEGQLGVIEEDPSAVADEMIAQLLAAESDEELEFKEAEGWRDWLNVPVEIRNVVCRPSEFEEGARFFMVVRGILDDGSQVVLTTGSRATMAQLINRAKRGTLVGAKVRAVEAKKPTRSGFRPYHLESVTAEGRSASQLTEDAKASA